MDIEICYVMVKQYCFIMSRENYRKALQTAASMNSQDISLDPEEYGMTLYTGWVPKGTDDWTNLTSQVAEEMLKKLNHKAGGCSEL